MRQRIEVDRVKSLFSYSNSDGLIIWNSRPSVEFKTERAFKRWNTIFSGMPAGAVHIQGYIVIGVDGITEYAHRIAWAISKGYWPNGIDHINGDRADNRISNLREVSHKENHKNRSIPKNNKSGVVGVYFDRKNTVWKVQISDCGNRVSKTFDSFFDACCFRKSKEAEIGYHKNHGKALPSPYHW